MKLVMLVAMAALLVALGACQTDVMGRKPAASHYTLENSPDNMHRNVDRGDVYLEEIIGRYDLGRD